MNKAILISIKPKWVKEILNGNKTIEIRKKFPKDYVGWVYIYCTKDKKYANLINRGGFLTGMVVARFWCDKVDDYVYGHKWSWEQGSPMWGVDYSYEKILKDTCLTDEELRAYVDDLCFSAIHITKLEIFDKPKGLYNFYKPIITSIDGVYGRPQHQKIKGFIPLEKAPQSWCYIEI